MTNINNLIPMNKRTKSEQRKIAQSGGIASGISRNNKKSMKELLNALLDTPLDDLEMLYEQPLPEKTHRAKVALGLVQSAEKGNIKAFETLMCMIGEQPKNNE